MTGLVLASASPRRLSLLETAGVTVALVLPADVDETQHADERPGALVRRLAIAKALAAAERLSRTEDASLHGQPVLGSDTVVALGATALGKPRDDDHAASMLRTQSGQVVTVWSGVAVTVLGDRDRRDRVTSAVVATLLRFRELSDDDVAAYVTTGEPRGVAGAFRIQGDGAALIAERHGCWTNVVGLPVCATGALLRPFGITLASDGCHAAASATDGARQ